MALNMQVSPAGGDRNRASELLGVSWTLFAISTILVSARVYTRLIIQKNVWWDDWMICITLAFVLAFTTLFTVYAANGGARHTFYLSPVQMQLAIKYNWIANVLIVIPLCTGKVSVALLIRRLLPPNSQKLKWSLYFICASLSAIIVFVVVVILCQCRPVRMLWDPTAHGSCWNAETVGNWNLFAGSYYAFMDFVLALLPILLIRQLQMSLRRKIAVCCLLGFGVVAGICAIVKTTYLPALKGADFTWDTTTFLIWNATETNVIIIAACIPTLNAIAPKAKELVKSYFTGSRFSTKKYASDKSYDSTGVKAARYVRELSDSDRQPLEMPELRRDILPGDAGGHAGLAAQEPWTPLPGGEAEVCVNDIRQVIKVDIESRTE